ncbi:MAG: SIMPL domain-containing protein [Aristaeellaceae bacterium]|nr:SIMPL domain-containing protein [Eubacteriales bacterium]
MKRIIAIALMMIMLLGCGALAEGTLNVTGSGTVYVAADRVSASLGISISGEDLAELQNQANERMSAICQALLDAGLEGSNISTNYLYISPRYDYSGEMEKITGYSISNSLTILTDDIDSIGSYIDAAFAAGANTFDSINFTTKDDSEAQRKALELAVADAQGKAEVIAAASGRSLGDILTISQGEEDDYSYYNSTAGSGMLYKEAAAMDGAATTVRAAQIKVSAQVQISYALN